MSIDNYESNVDISGLEKEAVLSALFNSSHQQGLGIFNTEGLKK